MDGPDTERLRRALARPAAPVFAVVDGAHWRDLPALLAAQGLAARSLFLGAARPVERSGPWFVPLPKGERDHDAAVGLLRDRPAAVFWISRLDAAATWRHLRTINQVRVEPAAGVASDGHAHRTAAPARTLLFRHWDPRVLSDVAPVLRGEQYARLLGPADEVVFLDPPAWGGAGVRRLVRLPDLPPASRGPLRLDAQQTAAIDAAAQDRSRRKVAAYLRSVAPGLADSLGEAGLADHVARSQATGEALGITAERAHMKWAFLMLATGGRAADMPEVSTFMQSGRQTPERRVDQLMHQLVGAARASELSKG